MPRLFAKRAAARAPVKRADPKVAAARLALQQLEREFDEMTLFKNEIEREIHAFNTEYYRVLGGLLEQLLELKLQQQKTGGADEKIAQAQDAFENFQAQRRRRDCREQIKIGEDERVELRALFKKACQKCHPDKLPAADKAAGEKIFKELVDANRRRDLPRMRALCLELQSRGDFTPASQKFDDAAALRGQIAHLRQKLAALRAEVDATISSDAYIEIIGIGDRAAYLERVRIRLQGEIDSLRAALAA